MPVSCQSSIRNSVSDLNMKDNSQCGGQKIAFIPCTPNGFSFVIQRLQHKIVQLILSLGRI